MANQISYIVKVIDAATAPMRKIGTAVSGMTRKFAGAGNAMRKLGYQFTSLRGIISATYGAAMIAFPIKKAIDFEEQLINIKRVAKFGSEDKFKAFRDGLIKTSLRLGIMPKEMGQMGYEVAKFVNDPKLIAGYTGLAAKVSRSFDIPGKEAAEQIGKISAKMGLNLKGMESFLDAVNYAADRSATSVKNQLQIIARVSTKMMDMKLPPNLAAGWANFADRLHATPRIAAKGLEMFFRAVGKMKGGYRAIYRPGADTNKLMVGFLKKLKDMPEVLRRIRLDKTFDSRVIEFINKAVKSIDKLDESLAFVSDKSKFAGSMFKELQVKLSSARTAMDRIRAVFHVVSITIGNAFLPLIKELTPIILRMTLSFREFVKEHPRLTKMVMGVIALMTAVSFATIFIGLLVIAISSLVSIPALIIMGFLAIGGALAYLWNKSDKLRESFYSAIAPVRELFSQLSRIKVMLFGGSSGDMSKVFGGIFWFFENVFTTAIQVAGAALNIFIVPLKRVFTLLEGIVRFFMNIDEHAKKLSDFASGISGGIGESLDGVSDFFSSAAKSTGEYVSSRVNQTQINGQIEVSASKGSEIRKSVLDDKPSGNLGMNMVDSY